MICVSSRIIFSFTVVYSSKKLLICLQMCGNKALRTWFAQCLSLTAESRGTRSLCGSSSHRSPRVCETLKEHRCSPSEQSMKCTLLENAFLLARTFLASMRKMGNKTQTYHTLSSSTSLLNLCIFQADSECWFCYFLCLAFPFSIYQCHNAPVQISQLLIIVTLTQF